MPARKPPPSSRPTVAAAVRGRSEKPPGKPAQGAAPRPVDDGTVDEIMRRFAAADPAPRGELEHVDPYTLLVAVVLSAQATDRSVNLATPALFAEASDAAAMVALGEERVAEHIRTVGLFRTKARNVVALSRILLEEHGGVVPPARAVLERLPGVGPKTASVVLNVAFGEPTIAVDTHVFRVSNRVPIAPGRTPDEVQLGLERRIGPAFLPHAHHWLILHGRYVCKARSPECGRCLIEDLCRYPAKTTAAQPASP